MADLISDLPDAILCHILSFLPTTNSIATSILSKRWKNLWCFVPALDFTEEDVEDPESSSSSSSHVRFSEFVYSVLLTRDATQPIKSFCLTSSTMEQLFDYSNLNKWLSFAFQRGIECLQLQLEYQSTLHRLPLRCNTLVVLKLEGFEVERVWPVALPAVKILHLNYITFHHTQWFMQLLSGCPILEDLQARYLVCMNDSVSYFKNLSLPKLIRAEFEENAIVFPLKVLSNVGFLAIEIDKVYLGYHDIPTFHNLTQLELTFDDYDWDLFIQVLKYCPKLQVLKLSENETHYGSDCGSDDQEKRAEPEFVPECLLLHLRTCTLNFYIGLPIELQLARYILKNARVLQSMKIWLQIRKKMIDEKLSSYPRSSATCQLSIA